MPKLLILPFPNENFYPRKEGDSIYPTHPGSALKIEEEIYEIIDFYVKDKKYYYVIDKWDERFVIRKIIEWDKEKEKQFIEEKIKEMKKEKKSKIAWSLQIFLGSFPTNYQEKFEEKLGLDPIKATFWSSLFEFIICLIILTLHIISTFSSAYGSSKIFSFPLWFVMLSMIGLLEGVGRLVYNISTNEPLGSLFFSFLNLKIKIEKGKKLSDSYKYLENILFYETPYEKKHWEKWGGINFEGSNYELKRKSKRGNFFIYEFLKGEKEFPKTSLKDEEKYNTSSDNSIVFALLWGFLDYEFQREIEKYGRYDPLKFTKISIIFNLIFSCSFFISYSSRIYFFGFTILRFFITIFSLYLLMESIERFYLFFEKKKIKGSFLGFFIKPIYEILIK